MEMDAIPFKTASDLASAIRDGELSASDVLEAHLSRIERLNPKLNAIVTLEADTARLQARQADADLAQGKLWGPLHGVPFTVKDTFETAGVRTTSSHSPLTNYIPRQNATVVARLKAAGAILLGKTNTPELAGNVQTDSPIFGRGNNPWDLERTPGGSTGGGAAAVAARLSPLEIGSDIGGSVRIPAHCCGIYSLKPTEHLVSGAGHIPDLPGMPKAVYHMNAFGPLARSVGDLSLVLPLMAGPDPRDVGVPPVPLTPVPDQSLQNLRLAWTDRFGEVQASAETRAALEGLAQGLSERGCQVQELTPWTFDFDQAWNAYGIIFGVESSVWQPAHQRWYRYLTEPMRYPNDPVTQNIGKAADMSMARYMRALDQREAAIQALEATLDHWDLLVCPVCTTPAFTHRPMGTDIPSQPDPVDGQPYPYWVATTYFTCPFNLTGNPVVVLPIGLSQRGLPLGVQLVGRRWQDMRLLAMASQIADVLEPLPNPPLS
jgi:amidase